MVADNPCAGSASMVLTLLLPSALLAQGSWSQTPTSGSPGLLAGHAAVYDLQRERTVLFGGHDQTYTPQGTTCEFDGVTWTPATTMSPPARTGHAMAYDATRGCTVLFGGAAGILAATVFNDTWEFDGSTWSQRLPVLVPPARADHVMAFDMNRGRVVLHGGRLDPWTVVADTWEWDGMSWTQMTAPGPSPRAQHAACYDFNRGRTVLFGGFDGQQTFGDTWEWDGMLWTQATASSGPSVRSGHAMAYDFSRAVSVLYGGMPNGAETWEWDGAAWTQNGSTSLPKTGHALVFDARLQRTTLCGGRTTNNPITFTGEIETYGHAIAGSFASHGASCPGSAATPQLLAPVSALTGPMIGQTSILQVIPSWFHVFFVFGWSDTLEGSTPLPIDLAAYGMPGCALQVSRDAITSSLPQNGVGTIAIPIANDPFLVGVRFFVQGFSLDLGANAGGFTTTNRMLATVGRT